VGVNRASVAIEVGQLDRREGGGHLLSASHTDGLRDPEATAPQLRPQTKPPLVLSLARSLCLSLSLSLARSLSLSLSHTHTHTLRVMDIYVNRYYHEIEATHKGKSRQDVET
jgi:hypothetical protein